MNASLADLLVLGSKLLDYYDYIPPHKNDGEWAGIPPSGKAVTLTGIDILRIVDGNLAEIWWGYDVLSMLQQLGAVPDPEQVGG